MALPKLSKLELQIMETLWTRGACSVRELQEAFPEKKRPAFTTVQTIVYRLEANMSPNTIGMERRRRFTLDGDSLILYPTPLPDGVVEWVVEWRRASR